MLAGVSQCLPNSDAIVYEEAFQPLELDRKELKYARLRRNIACAAKMHEAALPAGKKHHNVIMVTLTYRPEAEWGNKDMAAYLNHVRMWMKRRTAGASPLRYVWVAELTKAGRMHYHVLFWMPKGCTMPKADKQGWWPHGSTRTEKAVAPVKYVMKYASKMDSKVYRVSDVLVNGRLCRKQVEVCYPKGARCYGVGGLDQQFKYSRRWLNLPAFIKGRAAIDDRWTRASGGGWLEHRTGQVWPSEFGMCYQTPSKLHIVRLHKHERVIEADGPFNWYLPEQVH